MSVEITTPKLADLAPTWAPFRGWTVLFDNPGQPQRRNAPRLRAALDDAGSSLYRDLAVVARRLDQQHPDIPFGWLPPSTYHLTVMDGLSAPHVAMLDDERASRLDAALGRLPQSLADLDALTLGASTALERLCATVGEKPVEYGLESITCRGHAVLAELHPVGSALEVHDAIDRARHDSLEALESATGLALVTSWRPHVSLGYVANRAAASEFKRMLSAESDVHDAGSEHTIRFASASPYGFLDMSDYRRGRVRRRFAARRRVRSRRG